MNKMVVTSLESTFYTFDLRTLNPEKGFANTVTKVIISFYIINNINIIKLIK